MNRSKFYLSRRLRPFLMVAIATLAMGNLAWAGADGASNAGPETYSAKGNQLKEATNASAALRKKQGLGRTTTQDDRIAAARRNAERKAAAAKVKGRLP